ncbi:MAG: DUF1772 domain-containing protein [Acidimicrobiales bacterium]|nr:DUF1772 domain-containing protein [Acidimicrobiales bacterium]
MTARALLTGSGILMVGLMAGLFFGWMVSVIPGLSRISDSDYIATMQSINVAIVNPAFVIPFMLTPVVLAGAGVLEYRAGNQRRAWLLGVAAVTYVVGVLGITVGGNIPLNNTLDAFDLNTATASETATQRTSYERSWNRWHGARTVANAVSFGFAISSSLVAMEAE